MEDLEITIGMGLNMQLLTGESKRRHDVQVIGYLKGESLLVTMPRENGALAKIFPHDEYIVRYFKGKNIIAFKTRILHIATIPYYHLHLEFPQELEKVEIRQAERIRISVNAQTLVEGQKHWSVIRDISIGGAQVVLHEEVGKPEDHIELFFDLKIGEIEREIHLVALIRNIRKEKNTDTGKDEYRYGVEFIDPSEDDAVFVQGFVYEQLLTHRGVSR
jgi:c-di-GMP-binding flagellar brake protein YcgR